MNITTKFNIGDEVYWVGNDGILYMGEVQSILINFAENLLYKVYAHMWRRPIPKDTWILDEYGRTEDELPGADLFATEEEMISFGGKFVLKKCIKCRKEELNDLRRKLDDDIHNRAFLDHCIQDRKLNITAAEKAIAEWEKKLEEADKEEHEGV